MVPPGRGLGPVPGFAAQPRAEGAQRRRRKLALWPHQPMRQLARELHLERDDEAAILEMTRRQTRRDQGYAITCGGGLDQQERRGEAGSACCPVRLSKSCRLNPVRP